MRTLRYYGQRTLVSCTISRFSLKNRVPLHTIYVYQCERPVQKFEKRPVVQVFCGLSVRKRLHAGVVA